MGFGLGRLGWSPDEFWRATPREIAAALAGPGFRQAAQVPERGALNALMAAHPDGATERPSSHGG